MNEKKPLRLSGAELEIMKIVWRTPETTINDLLAAINSGREGKLIRTTIQVQVNRLEQKGWLGHREEGRTFYYFPTQGQEETAREILSDIRDRVFGGSAAELVKALFGTAKISQDEIVRVRKLLAEHEEEA